MTELCSGINQVPWALNLCAFAHKRGERVHLIKPCSLFSGVELENNKLVGSGWEYLCALSEGKGEGVANVEPLGELFCQSIHRLTKNPMQSPGGVNAF